MALLHTYDYGDPAGPPTLAIHGVTAHGRRWEALATGPWAHRRTVAVDLRGHGHSLALPPWSIEQHVTDLLDTLDAAGLERVDVVGHSYGGTIAVHLLAQAPERLRRLVLLDPALECDPGTMLANARAAVAFGGFASVEEATTARNAGLGDEIHPAVPVEIDQHLHLVDGRYRFRFEPAAAVTGWGEICRPLPAVALPCPTLLVGAARAPFVTDTTRRRVREVLGPVVEDATLDCGHLVYWERPAETATVVTAFLA